MFSGFPVIPSTNIHHNFPLCLLCKNSSKNLLSGSLMQASPCNGQDEQGKPRHMKNLLGGLAASINAGRPANSVCEQWERSSTKTSCRSERLRGREAGTWGEMCKRAAGEITHSACHGIKTEKGWCLEELKYIRSVLKLWAEVIYGSAAVQTPILTAASTMAQSCQ